MNTRVFAITIVIIVIVVSFAIYYSFHRASVNDLSHMSQSGSVIAVSSMPIHAPFSFGNFFQGEVALYNGQKFIDTNTQNAVSFQTSSGPQGVNPTFDVLVNGKPARSADPAGKPTDGVGGFGIAMATFSSDGKYFAFRARNDEGCAGGCQELTLYVVNISKLQTYSVDLPFSQINKDPGEDIFHFIESYSWGANNDALVTAYVVGNAATGLYRISPKETFDYNLTTGSSTLISETP